MTACPRHPAAAPAPLLASGDAVPSPASHRGRRALTAAALAAAAVAAVAAGCTPDLAGPSEPTGPPVVRGNGVAVSVAETCELPAMADTASVSLALNVAYRPDASARQRLAVAIPKGQPALVPVVVFVHGGGWASGAVEQHGEDMLRLASLGIGSISVGYRLAPGARFPTPLEDVRCALRWVRQQGARIGVDTSRVVLAGTSAGGHLAALAALTADDPRWDGDCPNGGVGAHVSGVIAVAAPADLRSTAASTSWLGDAVRGLLGAAPAASPSLAAQASPIVHVRPRPAFLLLHGTADRLVPLAQAEAFYEALRGAGAPATLVALTGVGHGLPITDARPTLSTATCTSVAFLRRVFGG